MNGEGGRDQRRLADFNKPTVTFSVVSGGSEESRIPILFPEPAAASAVLHAV